MNTVAKPVLNTELANKLGLRLQDELEVEDTQLDAVDWSNQTANSVSLNGIVVVKGDFTGTVLPKATFRDGKFEKCQLAGVVIDEGGFNRLELLDVQASGLTITNASIKDVLFKGCRLNLANFRFTHFKNVTFEDCVLAEADFAYAQLEHVLFRKCGLNGAQFSSVKLQHVDLRTSKIENLKGLASLKGATIDESQLITISYSLAEELGIQVAE